MPRLSSQAAASSARSVRASTGRRGAVRQGIGLPVRERTTSAIAHRCVRQVHRNTAAFPEIGARCENIPESTEMSRDVLFLLALDGGRVFSRECLQRML